ncbi:hypothetical protein LOK49_LG01G00231 [Camellia lanceoleosa]|uniref:Uncharacterized protein n=1 Tax=Camellia lanceoleosa TaxID=1840588 RepID=A0ACC0IWZ3_9ERIC|nr:hypothetical protein LOK49_LG01G00231 [Camellia lanceoleosa]
MEMTEDSDIQAIQMKAELDRGGKESITVYSCNCSIEALKRSEEAIDAADLVSEKHSFHPFPCDFSISGFLKWLSYDPCREVILQKQDICLSDVEDKRVAGLNDFSSLKECKCCLGGGGFCDLDIHAVDITTSQDANIDCSMFRCIETWWPTFIQRLW